MADIEIPVQLEVKPSITLTDAPSTAGAWKTAPCPNCKADAKHRTVTGAWGPEITTICTKCGYEVGRETR